MSDETESAGLKKIIAAIIDNTMSSDRAADLILKMLADEPLPQATPLLPPNTRPASRRRKPAVTLARLSPNAIDEDGYYPFETLMAVTGYAEMYLRKLLRTKPDELRSKKEGRYRLILGADIRALAEKRRRDEAPGSDGSEAA